MAGQTPEPRGFVGGQGRLDIGLECQLAGNSPSRDQPHSCFAMPAA
jgi:hypothetical protein